MIETPTHCVCCGAALVCAEEFLCSQNGCFIRWLESVDETSTLPSMASFTCDNWKREHLPFAIESE